MNDEDVVFCLHKIYRCLEHIEGAIAKLAEAQESALRKDLLENNTFSEELHALRNADRRIGYGQEGW